MVDKFNNSDC
ncbi:protein YbgV [Escherichia coli str. K-12 substr. MG1655]|uniref:Protein YbgV n=1 Tax=Escherichia coli (strain K12) TaxID=83333 RepID=YBGV_ECOLI|nr:protein YbgV [Escherichia coli str. K-12 substr. MG1655] [Escherichia coli]YP_010051177.1 protein YbgV [Escherichia coli str. K-12 substr. MG1655]P0DSE6.1 RecName: Full=Protein YbgV [Escherichia coli K-12]QNV50521.1 protein YbgV [Escherichia coli str. K-12 substr. MG1655]